MHKEIEKYLADLLPELQKAGIAIDEQQEIDYGVQIRVSRHHYKSILNIYYSQKKGISTVPMGLNNPLKKLLSDLCFLQEELDLKMPPIHNWNAWIGSDECGKGDYFGPLIVCAFAFERKQEKEFKNIGVMDSKKLKTDDIYRIAKYLYKNYANCINCIVLKPEKYNELIAKFKQQGKSLNDLLAWLHSTAIMDLQKKHPESEGALVDQFSNAQKVWRALKEKKFPLPCIERTGAEVDFAVAAASIIARYQFLESFAAMREFYQLNFPQGSQRIVIKFAQDFIHQYGEKRLGEVAKLHFKTTNQISTS
ncbi:MAG: ribonuclease HIII [Candidatus Cloacimonas sp.]